MYERGYKRVYKRLLQQQISDLMILITFQRDHKFFGIATHILMIVDNRIQHQRQHLKYG